MLSDAKKAEIVALLEQWGYIEQGMRPGLFIEKDSNCFVDLNRPPYVSGVLAGAKEITGQHGIMRLYSLEQSINDVLAIKPQSKPQPSAPRDVTLTESKVDNSPVMRTPSPTDCKPVQPAQPAKPPLTAKRKSNKSMSFAQMLDSGMPKEDIMQVWGLSESEFEKHSATHSRLKGVA